MCGKEVGERKIYEKNLFEMKLKIFYFNGRFYFEFSIKVMNVKFENCCKLLIKFAQEFETHYKLKSRKRK